MKMNSYYILLFLIPTILLGQSTYKSRRAAHDKEYLKTYEHSRLGFKFRYYSDFEKFPEQFYVDTTTWQRMKIIRYGISLNSPEPYSMRWRHKSFTSCWYDPKDSVASLDFGGGVIIDIYETSRKFYEIAFAENFYQYNPEDKDVYRLYPLDTVSWAIKDSQWVALNCGVPFDTKLLFGYSWKGLRGCGCFSVHLPEEMGSGVTYSNYIHGFVTHPTPHNTVLVVDFCDQPNENDQRSKRLNEIMFYELVASINWYQPDNIKR